jgi:hypothetical protein
MSQDRNHLNHATWECKYHVVFTPKYRKKLLFGQIQAAPSPPAATPPPRHQQDRETPAVAFRPPDPQPGPLLHRLRQRDAP